MFFLLDLHTYLLASGWMNEVLGSLFGTVGSVRVLWFGLFCRLAGGTDQVIIHAYLGGEGSSTSWELSGSYPRTAGNYIQCLGPSRAGGREHLQHIGLVGVRARR